MAGFSELLLLSVAFCAFLSPAFGASTNFRWCAKGEAELEKCERFKDALDKGVSASAGVEITPACVNGENAEGCMKKVKAGEADLITLDGGEIYIAGKMYEMVPVVAEDYGGGKGTSYYAVAVARANNTGVNLGNLKGKTSCHTGYQKTAGYNTPVGYLLESKRMERAACGTDGTAKSVSMFFKESCIPGAPSAYPNLCALCPKDNCKKDNTNRFYSYHGAFKCMYEGVGDVAFIKHLTTGEMVDEGIYGNLSDYVYLCTDNTRKAVTKDSYKSCNIAKVPSHAVMARSGSSFEIFKKVLLKASELCQGNSSATNCSGFMIFNSDGNNKNLLFKDSTEKLVDVGDSNTYKKWLGEDYYKTVEGLNSQPCEPSKASLVTLVPGFSLVLLAIGALVMRFV